MKYYSLLLITSLFGIATVKSEDDRFGFRDKDNGDVHSWNLDEEMEKEELAKMDDEDLASY